MFCRGKEIRTLTVFRPPHFECGMASISSFPLKNKQLNRWIFTNNDYNNDCFVFIRSPFDILALMFQHAKLFLYGRWESNPHPLRD